MFRRDGKYDFYFAKVHTLHSFTTQSWSHWGTWACLTRANDKLDDLIACYLLSRHLCSQVSNNIERGKRCWRRDRMEPRSWILSRRDVVYSGRRFPTAMCCCRSLLNCFWGLKEPYLTYCPLAFATITFYEIPTLDYSVAEILTSGRTAFCL